MIKIQDAHLTTDAFQFRLVQPDIVQLSFGPTHICMSLDAALDFQYRLAGFLACTEMRDYSHVDTSQSALLSDSDSDSDLGRDSENEHDHRLDFQESLQNLVDLTVFQRPRLKN